MARYIWYRGKRMTPAFRDAWMAAEEHAGFTFHMTQGGFNAGGVLASAGTHDGDGGDWSVYEGGKLMPRWKVAKMIESLRWAGIAAWLRTTSRSLYGVRAQGFGVAHVHGVPNGWGSPSAGAARQAVKYRAGRDGLRANLRDIGPGHTSKYRQRRAPQRPKPTTQAPAPKPTPTPPQEELTMADISKLLGEIGALREETRYVQKQLKAIAEGTYSRKALDARAATNAHLIRNITGAQSEMLAGAIREGQGTLSPGVMDQIQGRLEQAIASAVADAAAADERAIPAVLRDILDDEEVSA